MVAQRLVVEVLLTLFELGFLDRAPARLVVLRAEVPFVVVVSRDDWDEWLFAFFAAGAQVAQGLVRLRVAVEAGRARFLE